MCHDLEGRYWCPWCTGRRRRQDVDRPFRSIFVFALILLIAFAVLYLAASE
jgi:hypothetical protein